VRDAVGARRGCEEVTRVDVSDAEVKRGDWRGREANDAGWKSLVQDGFVVIGPALVVG